MVAIHEGLVVVSGVFGEEDEDGTSESPKYES